MREKRTVSSAMAEGLVLCHSSNDRKATMSFSITFFEKEIQSSISATVDAKIAEIPNENGRKEAEAFSSVIPEAILALSQGNGDLGSVYISGSISPGQNAQLSINVTFQTTEQKRQAEEQAIIRARVDAEREQAEKSRAAVRAQGPQKVDAAKKA